MESKTDTQISEGHHCSNFQCPALSLDLFLQQKIKLKPWSICNSSSALFTVILIFFNARLESCANLLMKYVPLEIFFLSSSKVKLKWTTKHGAVQASPGQFTAQSRWISFYHNTFVDKQNEGPFHKQEHLSVVLVQAAGQLTSTDLALGQCFPQKRDFLTETPAEVQRAWNLSTPVNCWGISESLNGSGWKGPHWVIWSCFHSVIPELSAKKQETSGF